MMTKPRQMTRPSVDGAGPSSVSTDSLGSEAGSTADELSKADSGAGFAFLLDAEGLLLDRCKRAE